MLGKTDIRSAIRQISVLLIIVSLVLSVTTTSGLAQQSEQEPNDNRSEANVIETDTTVTGKTTTLTDTEDWFAFEMQEGDALKINITDFGAGGTLEWILTDPAGNEIASTGGGNAKRPDILQTTAQETGTYYLQIKHRATIGAAAVPQPDYSFDVSIITPLPATKTERESTVNDGENQAMKIQEGTKIRGIIRLSDTYDDWFKFDAQKGEQIRVDFNATGIGIKMTGPSGDTLDTGVSSEQVVTRLNATAPETGTYYLRVFGPTNALDGTVVSYTIVTATSGKGETTETEEQEPNESTDSENAAGGEDTATVTIESTGDDRAFYEFTTDGEVEAGEQANLVNAEYPDTVTDRGAGGSVLGGADTFQVSGEITHMDVDGPVNVYIDGEQVDVEEQWGPSLSNTLTVRSTGDQRATYEFTVTDAVELGDEANPIRADHPDTVSDQSASGSVLGGEDTYQFSGDLTDFQVDGPVEVYVNGEQVDLADIDSESEESDVDAEIIDFAPEEGIFTPGERQTAEVTIENTGSTRHTFFVGYSVRSPDGEGLHNGGPPPRVTLAPGESETVTVEWTVEDDAPTGTYGAFTAVWEGRDGDDLQTQLDRSEQTNVFTVEDTEAEATATATPVATATTTGFQAGYGGASDETTASVEPATTVTESEPTTESNTETTTTNPTAESSTTVDNGEESTVTDQGTAQQTTGTTGPGFGTLAALLAIIVLALFAARRT